MKVSAWLLSIAACIVLTGCTQYWYQEGKTFQQCQQDFKECRQQMQKSQDPGQVDLGVYADRCEKECMQAKGYRLVGEGDLPDNAKRVSSMNEGQTYGIAGSAE